MKKVLMIAAVTGVMYGCWGNASKTGAQNEQGVEDVHTAKISLDYEGTYIGNLPAADCEGMSVSITLEKDTYMKKLEYIGKEGVYMDTGKYTWNDEGNTVILEGITDAPNQYFVGENCLIQLDMDGNRITSEFADLYVLKKQTE